MAGTAVIPDNIGEGGAHISGFSRSGGLGTILKSILDDLKDVRDNYNIHTHGASVPAPQAVSPLESVTIGTKFESEV